MATVREVTAVHVTLTVECHDPSPITADVLLLAVPRPKVLLRMLAHAAALGFARIVLFRSWRVDKSHLQSTAMLPAVQREQLLLGLEQAGRTRVPAVAFWPLFKPMVEDELPRMDLPTLRCVGHPTAAVPSHELRLARGAPFALALGPDGGLIPYEVAALAAAGFLPITSGAHALRTETALAVLWGQLDLLRQRGSLRP
jgi:RsmE family RNA methyltransferase